MTISIASADRAAAHSLRQGPGQLLQPTAIGPTHSRGKNDDMRVLMH